MKKEEFLMMLCSVLSAKESVESPQFLSCTFLLRWVLKHLVWYKCRENHSVGDEFYFEYMR